MKKFIRWLVCVLVAFLLICLLFFLGGVCVWLAEIHPLLLAGFMVIFISIVVGSTINSISGGDR